MAHTFNTGVDLTGSIRPLWRRVLPEPVRSLGRPFIHVWQRFSVGRKVRKRHKIESHERRALLSHAIPIIQDVYGFRFVVYPYDHPNLINLARHPADAGEIQVIRRLVRPGDVVIDIGANIGLYSVALSQLCGCSGRVWAFEPVLDTYWRLRETLALNRCANVVPVQAAVSQNNGTVTMSVFESGRSEWNTLGHPEIDPCGNRVQSLTSVQVPSFTLDHFCETENIARISFLKVDVEGFEVCVFSGADELLRNQRVDCICFEISQRPLRNAGFTSRDVFAALEARGYTAYALDKGSGKFSGPIHDSQEQWTNYFASPNDLSNI